jgi:hypothetical protein
VIVVHCTPASLFSMSQSSPTLAVLISWPSFVPCQISELLVNIRAPSRDSRLTPVAVGSRSQSAGSATTQSRLRQPLSPSYPMYESTRPVSRKPVFLCAFLRGRLSLRSRKAEYLPSTCPLRPCWSFYNLAVVATEAGETQPNLL